jgi:DNA-binding GntR family transcriptional regulator
VRTASDAVLDELERSHTAVLRRLKASSDPDPRLLDAALQVDWGMHNLVVGSLGNRIMISAHQQNFDKIRMIRLHGRSPHYLPLAMDEHLAVIAAMKGRDPDQAAAALERHLQAAERRALGM